MNSLYYLVRRTTKETCFSTTERPIHSMKGWRMLLHYPTLPVTIVSRQSMYMTEKCEDGPDHLTSFSISQGIPTYRYRYMARFPEISPPPLRAFHGSDLFILFATLQGYSSNSSSTIAMASTYLENAWSAFVADPVNGLAQLGWPRYTRSTGSTTLVEIFPNNNVEEPIQLVNPATFEARCAALL
jgi:carboxylesterase type B